jgi:N-acetylglutamate synthase-like GNAT family acetyltransferase
MEIGDHKTRQLDKNEKIPYDLLLLADETVEAINNYIHEADLHVLEHEGRLIGIYALYPLNATQIEIKNIAVLKKYQGQGIGKLLLRDAEIRSTEMGFEELLIGTADAASKQLHLYQKIGFQAFSIKKDFFINNYPEPIFENDVRLKDMIMLRKKLYPNLAIKNNV